jgi:hypothetical protein
MFLEGIDTYLIFLCLGFGVLHAHFMEFNFVLKFFFLGKMLDHFFRTKRLVNFLYDPKLVHSLNFILKLLLIFSLQRN